ncbi:MAG TPA: orotate phosphoribosyltransferase [Prolixibacteraceae bacterium]|jgi:orotate phosphoribosyltransferase|nr:MAG: Orotate phosphoribosyltransferase [Bacteroidetes bacterium ADurb.Bin123]HNZ69659.1 orotate phosphoribosyltransferase [Prolixibacteraceae bacterium]HOC87257.1 orotate phosphoribosyltransferase [Prolixibacteraceae bacterium]HOG96547.1 orotate phosphoribosyltransferase [Prolixibacteraceae bacterium]HPI34170.1 orotate phosphoribosyltransferase [Prolixibacteraceae bacterium]
MMEKMQVEVAQLLLQINTIKVQPSNPFSWASGWKAPIYCDNRKILSYPAARSFIRDQFVQVICQRYPEAEAIAGVATGAIAHGALVAGELGLPFAYVRSEPKGHGLENLIEGDLKPGQKVVIIEDLVSTGSSSLKAVRAVRQIGSHVLGMVAIFTYDFPQSAENFRKEGVELITLSRYQVLIGQALASGKITEEQLEKLMLWREDPANWGR